MTLEIEGQVKRIASWDAVASAVYSAYCRLNKDVDSLRQITDKKVCGSFLWLLLKSSFIRILCSRLPSMHQPGISLLFYAHDHFVNEL